MRALLGLLLVFGSAQALQVSQMQARDIDRDGVTDAYFDPQTNLTWLANLNPTCPNNDNTANPFCGMSGWRLNPTLEFLGTTWRAPVGTGSCDPQGMYPFNCHTDWYEAPSENIAYTNVPTAFQTLWAGSQVGGLCMLWGGALLDECHFPGWVPWVRDGDVQATVNAIPEPSTYALMLAGVAFLIYRQNRRGRQALT